MHLSWTSETSHLVVSHGNIKLDCSPALLLWKVNKTPVDKCLKNHFLASIHSIYYMPSINYFSDIEIDLSIPGSTILAEDSHKALDVFYFVLKIFSFWPTEPISWPAHRSHTECEKYWYREIFLSRPELEYVC